MSTTSLRSTSPSSSVNHSAGESASHDATSPSTSITAAGEEGRQSTEHEAYAHSSSAAVAVGNNPTTVSIPTVRSPSITSPTESLPTDWAVLKNSCSPDNDIHSSSSSTVNGEPSFLNVGPPLNPSTARRSKSGKLHILPPFISPVDSPAEAPSTPNEVGFNRMAEEGEEHLAIEEGDRKAHSDWHEQPGNGTPWSLVPNDNEGRTQHAGQVEKSIAASLTNAEPAARSRKTSHSLGLFKENVTVQDHKRREEKRDKLSKETTLDPVDEQARERQLSSSDDSPLIIRQASSPHPRNIEKADPIKQPQNSNNQSIKARHGDLSRDLKTSNSGSSSRQNGLKWELGSVDTSQEVDDPFKLGDLEATDSVSRHHSSVDGSIPPSLLAEIRARRIATSFPESQSSVSRSLPTTTSMPSRRTADTAPCASDIQISRSDTMAAVDDQAEEQDDEAEESEHDEIASALYIPHQTPKVDAEPELHASRPELEVITSCDQDHGEDKGNSDDPILADEAFEVDISLQQDGSKSYLHGDLHSSTNPAATKQILPTGKGPEALYSTATETEYELLDEGKVEKDETSLTDDFDLDSGSTPVSTAPIKRHKHRPPIHPHPNDSSLVPLNAVELKPYKHQVGGHTTVFRFSRRAVCKPMSNRENEFYETIERQHPELLVFLPRYIGVLNVTFKKSTKRKKKRSKNFTAKGEESKSKSDRSESISQVGHETRPTASSPNHLASPSPPRLVSHSQQTLPTPRVIFENNRHIIPQNLFGTPPEPFVSGTSLPVMSEQSRQPKRHRLSSGSSKRVSELSRPSLEKHHHASWGATSVNHQLRAQVLREVFSSPTIHQNAHHKYSRSHMSIPYTKTDLTGLATNSDGFRGATDYRRSSVDLLPARDPQGPSEGPKTSSDLNRERKLPVERTQTDTSANSLASEEAPPNSSAGSRTSPSPRRLRRRHSGMGLRRRRRALDGSDKGELQYYEDDGYGGDGEDELFAMDEEPSTQNEEKLVNGISSTASPAEAANNEIDPLVRTISDPVPDPLPIASLDIPDDSKPLEPQSDGRVEHFLLLEDVTSGMRRPCVLDLKMGTRQYGIDADEKKQLSQRRKAANTTSGKLGVRICGMQVWNAKEELFSYQDKYYGRDLKQGMEFQAALTRFFYNGLNYDNIVASIPVLLDKIKGLEVKIKSLRGYRFYASSLLLLYDGFPETESAQSESTVDGKPEPEKEKPTITVKIVDFANCVTAEDIIPEDVQCPPKDPNGIDKGFLRGLKNLRLYLYRILTDTKAVREKGSPDLDESQGPPQLAEPYTDPAGQRPEYDVSD